MSLHLHVFSNRKKYHAELSVLKQLIFIKFYCHLLHMAVIEMRAGSRDLREWNVN